MDIVADTITLSIGWKQVVLSHYPPAARNPNLDLTLNANSLDDEIYYGVTVTLTGYWDSISAPGQTIYLTVSLSGTSDFHSVNWGGERIDILFSLKDTWAYTEPTKLNWIKWSNIGSLDFTIWKDNIAGERPMEWKGFVHRILKLGKRFVVYGQRGIAVVSPSGNAFDVQKLSHTGLFSQMTAVGTDTTHWFIDKNGTLCELSDQISEIGYSEFLGSLTNPVMLYDELNELVYISDADTGYVYNPVEKSLGKAQAGVAGLGLVGTVVNCTGAETVTTPTVEICTDILDFGTRNLKSVYSVEVATNLTNSLYVCIEYRRYKNESFSATDWRLVNEQGYVYLPCYGTEFRIRVKSSVYENYEIDYITINGDVHDS